jgi:hypothetical protein
MFDIFGARGLAWFCAGERVRENWREKPIF